MSTWDFAYIQTELADLLNFNSAQTDQDFTTAQLKRAINRAYFREVGMARLEGCSQFFFSTQDYAWTSGSVTYTLPDFISQKSIIRIIDVTGSDPGDNLIFDKTGFAGDVFWKDKDTLQWGDAGPSSDKTIRFEFFAEAVEMVADGDEPSLIPSGYREVILWSAGIDMRRRADEASPGEWQQALNDLRLDYWKHISRGRPFSDTPTISNTYQGSDVGFTY